ncbi:MAG TPA: FecR domain-containing protein [Chitinophagaceae bacterium]
MDLKQFQELIERYLSEQSSSEETKNLKQLINDPEYLAKLGSIMDEQLANNPFLASDYPQVIERLKNGIEKDIAQQKKLERVSSLRIVRRWMAAAAVFILIASISFLWSKKRDTDSDRELTVTSSPIRITPGKDGAILTLSDNTTIVLDSADNGIIATQNGSDVVLNNGQLIYKTKNHAGVAYNTMTTPKGRQFSLVLPDGTKAWLNAGSSLRYPTAFVGKERKVEVTGEVYFEVAKNERMPFKVKVNERMEVVVLGTHFNINSYSNEASINTTLLEGSVQISNETQNQILKPGQQANVNSDQKINIVNNVNLKKVMAWKNGVFDFDDASLQEVMRQLERWYDIEVVYEKGVPDIEFVGTLARDLSLEDILKGLKLSEVNLRIEGRKLIVMP